MLNKIARLINYLNPKDFIRFLKAVFRKRRIVMQMVQKDFKKQYLGSFLGIFWAFFQPAVYIFVLWFIFAVGFRKGRAGEFPFSLYLMSGMIVWIYFSESLMAGAQSIVEHSYLVKKMIFQISLLPIVKILSTLIVHVIFIGIFLIFYFIHGYVLDIYALQIFYYLFSTIVFLLGISWISASLNVFMKDVSQIIRVIIRLGFWFTPIFWEITMLPPKYQLFFKLNPVYYLINGYRNTFFYKVWFWEHYTLTAYFWILTLGIFIFGAVVFKRLRPHFADVL